MWSVMKDCAFSMAIPVMKSQLIPLEEVLLWLIRIKKHQARPSSVSDAI